MTFPTRVPTVGELLDRALSTYVQYVIPVSLLVALMVIPANILYDVVDVLAHGHFTADVTPPATAPAAAQMAQTMASIFTPQRIGFGVVIPLLADIWAKIAVYGFMDGALDARPLSVLAAYGFAAKRFGAAAVVWCVFAVATLCTIVAAGLVLGVSVFAGLVVTRSNPALFAGHAPLLVALLIVVALPAIVAAFVLIAVCGLACDTAIAIGALENVSPRNAVAQMWRALGSRTQRRRTLAVAAAYLALGMLDVVLNTVVSQIATSLSVSPLVRDLADAAVDVGLASVVALYVFLYVRDVQIRRYGRDLLAVLHAGGGDYDTSSANAIGE